MFIEETGIVGNPVDGLLAIFSLFAFMFLLGLFIRLIQVIIKQDEDINVRSNNHININSNDNTDG